MEEQASLQIEQAKIPPGYVPGPEGAFSAFGRGELFPCAPFISKFAMRFWCFNPLDVQDNCSDITHTHARQAKGWHDGSRLSYR